VPPDTKSYAILIRSEAYFVESKKIRAADPGLPRAPLRASQLALTTQAQVRSSDPEYLDSRGLRESAPLCRYRE
jgi:hypothetical protein